jgi:hypothetical protein
MKKSFVLASFVASQLISAAAMAGATRFDTSEFNSIIAENQKQEKELRHQLQKEVGVDYKMKKEPFKIDRSQEPQEAQVAVSSKDSILNDKENRVQAPSEKSNMKRLSQEFDQEQ